MDEKKKITNKITRQLVKVSKSKTQLQPGQQARFYIFSADLKHKFNFLTTNFRVQKIFDNSRKMNAYVEKNALRYIVQDQPATIVATLPHSLSQEFPNLLGALTAHPAVSILQQPQRSVKSFLRSTMKEDRLVGQSPSQPFFGCHAINAPPKENGTRAVIGQFGERNVVRMSAAVLLGERCVTSKKRLREDYWWA